MRHTRIHILSSLYGRRIRTHTINVCSLWSCTKHRTQNTHGRVRLYLCDDAWLLLILYHSWFFCPSRIDMRAHIDADTYTYTVYSNPFHFYRYIYFVNLIGLSCMLLELSKLLLSLHLKHCLSCCSVYLPSSSVRFTSLYQFLANIHFLATHSTF